MAKDILVENCPKCNSDNCIVRKQTGYMALLSILLLGIPFPIFKKKKYCYECGNEWGI
jgi:hypothetical protein